MHTESTIKLNDDERFELIHIQDDEKLIAFVELFLTDAYNLGRKHVFQEEPFN